MDDPLVTLWLCPDGRIYFRWKTDDREEWDEMLADLGDASQASDHS